MLNAEKIQKYLLTYSKSFQKKKWIDELIELIKPKMKGIIISNNKFAQELFELPTVE